MKNLILTLCLILVQVVSFAQKSGIPAKQNRLVNNFSKAFPDFISASEMEVLEEKLKKFSLETSNQIVVVIVDDLAGYEPAQYTARLGESWGVGQEKQDNGVIILIKPTGGQGQRKVFISPGRGLTGAIPSLTANDIVEKEMIPNFKNGENFKGIESAVNVIMSLAKGEYNSKSYSKNKKKSSGFIIIAVIVAIIVLVVRFGPKGKGGGGSGFTYGAAGFMAGRAFGSGGFGGGSSSSGGFGGFGGGSFGGGGSGGSW